MRVWVTLSLLLLAALPVRGQAPPVRETVKGLLAKARQDQRLGRLSGKRYFRSSERVWIVETRIGNTSVWLRWTEVDRRKRARKTTCILDGQGRLIRYGYSEGYYGGKQPRRVASAERNGKGSFDVETAGFGKRPLRKLPWPDEAAPTAVVLFLIAPLYDIVPGGGRHFRLLQAMSLESKEGRAYFDTNHEEREGTRVLRLGDLDHEFLIEVETVERRRGRIVTIAETQRAKLLAASEDEITRFLTGKAPPPKPKPQASRPNPGPSRPGVRPSPVEGRPRPTRPARPSASPSPEVPARTRDRETEVEGIRTLKGLFELQQTFRREDRDKNGVSDYAADLATLVKAFDLPGSLRQGKTGRYSYRIQRSARHPAYEWMAVAEPLTAKGRFLGIDAHGRVVASRFAIPLSDTAQLPEKLATLEIMGAGRDPRLERLEDNERIADLTLTQIQRLQILYALKDQDQNGARDFAPDLGRLISASGAKDAQELGKTGVRSGYRFRLIRSSEEPTKRWLVVADPVEPGQSGRIHFALNHEGKVARSRKGPYALAPSCEIQPAK